jgi:hypothetical protein
MNSINLSQRSLLTLKRHAVLVFCICYIPHITTEPAWLFILFLCAISYRLIADYFSYPPMPWWASTAIVIACIFLLSENIYSSGFFIRFLLTYIILKCLELHTTRDLRVMVLSNFFVIFTSLIVTQDLWIIIYLFVSVFANLSIMIKLTAPEVTLSQIGSKSGKQLLIIIPLSIFLFYVFPRIDPLWHVQALPKFSTGLSESMNPGSISQLFNDDSTAMRITFSNTPTLQGYWRAIILSFYSGENWQPAAYNFTDFTSVNRLNKNESADYEILLEPTQIRWLVYEGYPVAANTNLIFSSNHGLIRENKQPITKRFAYSLKVQPAPYHALNSDEYAEALQLPKNSNPRLNTWAKEQFTKSNNDINVFIPFLRNYIHEQAFWYTLTPPKLISDNNQMDKFWFGTQKGFCEHYASAVTFILRAAGIPARVVVGYHGGKWNPITQTITIQQNTAHAWLEYWQKDIGWKPLDPTSFIAIERVDQTIQSRETDLLNQGSYLSMGEAPWREKINLLVDSVRFYSQRWFLFYNQNTQKNLLQNLGLGEWNTEELLQISVSCIPVFFILIGLYYQWREKRNEDPLLVEYHLLQNEFRRFNVSTQPSATLLQQCDLFVENRPALGPLISSFIDSYEQLRLMQKDNTSKDNKIKTITLFKKLRQKLSSI